MEALGATRAADPTEPFGQVPPQGTPAEPPSSAVPRTAGFLLSLPELLGPPEALDFALLPLETGGLAVWDRPRAPVAALRRLRPDGTLGPLVLLPGEHVASAVVWGDGSYTVLGARGKELCLSTLGESDAQPRTTSCAPVAPVVASRLGEQLALFEVEPLSRASTAAPLAPKKAGRTQGAKARGAGARLPTSQAKSGRGRERQAPEVEVWLRLADRQRGVGTSRSPLGLRFARPLEGWHLVGAAPRPEGAELLAQVLEPQAPAGQRPGKLGWARLASYLVGLEGKVLPGPGDTVYQGPLEWAGIGAHRGARLVPGNFPGELWALGTTAERRCEALPLRGVDGGGELPPNLCALGLFPGLEGAPLPLEGLEALLAERPRRVRGQPLYDPGRVVWAGARAFWSEAGELRGASPSLKEASDPEGPARVPFSGRSTLQLRVALDGTGEGLAWGPGGVVRVTQGGQLERSASPLRAKALGGPQPEQGLLERLAALPEEAQLARVGETWWALLAERPGAEGVAGSEVRRGWGLLPLGEAEPGRPRTLDIALRGGPETSRLVGGQTRGWVVAWRAGELLWASLEGAGGPSRASQGAATPLALQGRAPSPLRPGFQAVPRAAGGALLVGLATGAADRVLAVTLDAQGRLGAPQATSLRAPAGTFGLRLAALPRPRGGALLSAVGAGWSRGGVASAGGSGAQEVLWLDDDGLELARAAWPEARAEGSCLEGEAPRLFQPSPEPGRLVRVEELARQGTCLLGEPRWAPDGSLRWWGVAFEGLEARPYVRAVAEPGEGGLPHGPLSLPARALSLASSPPVLASSGLGRGPSCPPDMVLVAGRYCVDRFEGRLLDASSGAPWSPDWPTTPGTFEASLAEWATGRERTGDLLARAFPLPEVPPSGPPARWSVLSRAGVQPSGYVSGLVAAAACQGAGKRLCTREEFVRACRGERDTPFPYGAEEKRGLCNVNSAEHPAARLHGNAALGHLDPRLNAIEGAQGPLLRATGSSPACRSEWGGDAIYDLVGNLDEWVEGPSGFAGGFYARATHAGCDAFISAHPPPYLDYSVGVRCCLDADSPRDGASPTTEDAR